MTATIAVFVALGILILYLEFRIVDPLQAIKDGISALAQSVADEITRITNSLNAADPSALQASITDAVSKLTALKASVDAVDPAAPAAVTPATPAA